MIICAAAIVTVAMGVRQAFGLFLAPISVDLDVGRQTFGLAIALQNLVFGLAQPFVGAYADRHGAGKVAVAGALTYGAGLVLTTVAGSALGLNLTLGLMVGVALSAVTFVVVLGAVARAVPPERRSLAFGIVTAGGSLGQFLVVPIAQAGLDGLGWRGAMVALAVGVASIIVLALGVSGRPSAPATAGGGQTLKEALHVASRHPTFWLLNLGFFVCGFHIAFVGTHLPAFLRDQGLTANVGAAALALIGLFNIVGSWLWGAWGGRRSKRLLLATLYLCRGAAITVFVAAPLTPASVLVFAAAFGFLWLGTVPLTSGLVGQIYGVQHLSALYGIVFLSHQVGSFFGAWLAGLAFDTTGSYQVMWLISIVLAVMAAAVHWPVDERELQPAAAPA